MNRQTLWRLEPHTQGKHFVLKRYLDAWLPIMGRKRHRILFIDGFAGPGEYVGGEEGSPLIALRALKEHSARHEIVAEVVFIFIEKDERRADHLTRTIERWQSSLPSNCRIEILKGLFDETVTQALDELDAQQKHLAPCFVMIDPFGVSGTPMSVIRRILQNPKSEVYISFMYESINRFKNTPEFGPHLDQLFGCKMWRKGVHIENPSERKNFFYDLYEQQLRHAGAQYVVHFELYNDRRLVYAVFFGTKHVTGCERMKQAIWRIAPWGDFAFRGTRFQQLTLGLDNPNFALLKDALRQRFCGEDWISIGHVERFVASDQTDFLISHLRKQALVPMENAGEIEVDERTRRRKRTYPPGTLLRFL
jgi:three-Cys-motif partner protein